MGQFNVGDMAPAFSLRDQDGKMTSLVDFRGRKLLVFFYPKANTPGCTRQACSVRDAMEDLAEAGVIPVGISPDAPEKQKAFDGKHDLDYPLLSDPDHRVALAYGAWGEKSMYGKTYEGIVRSSFLIDENGLLLQISVKVKPLDTVPNAQAALEQGHRAMIR